MVRRSPVLLMAFNRPRETSLVFDAIRQAKPPKLYVACDGPRSGNANDRVNTQKVRQILTSVDWKCEVKSLFRDENLGCKFGVAGALDWFFDQEPRGIILEDDCLPNQDFFTYCEMLLERYENNEDIWSISGANFLNSKDIGPQSYYFSKYNHVWGWASWRRAWKKRDLSISFWDDFVHSEKWLALMNDSVERAHWEKTLSNFIERKIDTWDYAWTATAWYHGAIHITPKVNLVSNIGFVLDATHTKRKIDLVSNLKVNNILPLKFTDEFSCLEWADQHVFDNLYEGKYKRTWLGKFTLLGKKIKGRIGAYNR